MINCSEMTTKQKLNRLNQIMENRSFANPDEVDLKICFEPILHYLNEESYREFMVSYLQMVPLFEKPQVTVEYADYIIYMHPYARCEDASPIVLADLRRIAHNRKEGAEIIVVGKSANAEKLLNGEIDHITFWGDHFTEKLGQKFGLNMKEQYFVYDDESESDDVLNSLNEDLFEGKQLNIWPVDGCLQKCKFCRRCYMDIKFESLSLDTIKAYLDKIKEEHPEWLRKISLRAENLTEYGIDLYGKQMLHELLDLLNSYNEIKTISFPIGLAIGEFTPEILDAFCRLNKEIDEIALNLEAGNRMLKVIGKQHTSEDAVHIYNTIRAAHPEAYFSSTVMIGLPTETISDIFELAEVIGLTKPDFVLFNYYIYAPKHELAKLPQISDSLREYHLKILLFDALPMYIKHEFDFECWEILKKKYSRKTLRRLERLKKRNQYLSFPGHLSSEGSYKLIPKKHNF